MTRVLTARASQPVADLWEQCLICAVKHLRSFLVDERAPIVARPDLAAGAEFPLGWRLRVPQVGLDLRLQTLNEQQFIRIVGAGTIWEGAARTTRGPKGLCYVEDSRTIGLG